jgi:predicted O-methyltransferase YrrM
MKIAEFAEDMYPVLEPYLHPMDRTPFGDEFLRTKNYYEWYATIAEMKLPSSICEIGVRFGYSAISMLWGIQHADPFTQIRYLGIDNETAEKGSNLFAFNNIGKFTNDLMLMNCDSSSTGHIESKFDLIYVDGMHTVSWMLKDLQFAKAVIKNGGWIMVDDVTLFPGLMRPAKDWAKENGFDYRFIPSHRGLLLLT